MAIILNFKAIQLCEHDHKPFPLQTHGKNNTLLDFTVFFFFFSFFPQKDRRVYIISRLSRISLTTDEI